MNHSLPSDRLEQTKAWGGASSVMEYVYRPSTTAEVRQILDMARRRGLQVGLRGAGYSYGDAPLNAERIVLDCSRMDRILEWDPDNGIISVEPGVTVSRLWRYCLGDGWWPPVVPGTMFPTLGGCLGSNIHGKNNWHAGTLGDHTLEFEALLPNGEHITCRPDHNSELFYGMIGSFGALGVFTRITLRLHQISSGNLRVRSLTEPNIEALVARMEQLKDGSEYLVGWVDGIARGQSLGRGQIHTADYFDHGEDPEAVQSLRLEYQDLPEAFFGLIPKSVMWVLMRPFMNNLGVPFINRGRYWSARLAGDHEFVQSMAEFNFLLDYIPNWKLAYQPLGLVQFQTFLPADRAATGIGELLRLSQRRGLPTYLGVLKRHRPDDFLLSHALDGFSIAMDYRVTRRNRAAMAELLGELEQCALQHGGRFYLAKDSSLQAQTAREYLGDKALSQFEALKLRCDPEQVLSTNLLRRVFPDLISTESSALAAGTPAQVSKVSK
jgi:FAD/FMN-containing dehydrogenase